MNGRRDECFSRLGLHSTGEGCVELKLIPAFVELSAGDGLHCRVECLRRLEGCVELKAVRRLEVVSDWRVELTSGSRVVVPSNRIQHCMASTQIPS